MVLKKTILLAWQYSRKDWVEVFKNLSNDFNFIFLGEIYKENSTDHVKNWASIYYWSDFSSANQLLKDLQPYKIVFMGMESLHSIALNYVAKKNKIETIYLQHGMYHPLKVYLKNQTFNDKINKKKIVKNSSHGLFMLKFYINSFKLNSKAYKYLFKFIYFKNKISQTQFLLSNKFDYRIVDKYLVFTKINAEYLMHRDGFNASKYFEIGSPSLDKFFHYKNNEKEKILLIIDTPLVEVVIGENVEKKHISVEEANSFYSKINIYAKQNNLRLKIKLHPYNYNSSFYIIDDNIEYIKETNIERLIGNSEQIISFNSSLVLPLLLSKDKVILLRANEDEKLFDDLENWGFPKILTIKELKLDNLVFRNISDYPNVKNNLINNYIFKFDGNSTKRLKFHLEN